MVRSPTSARTIKNLPPSRKEWRPRSSLSKLVNAADAPQAVLLDLDGTFVTTCPIGGSVNVSVSNLKSVSATRWGDGLNIFSCTNVVYNRVSSQSPSPKSGIPRLPSKG